MDKKYEGLEETERDEAMGNDGWKRPGSGRKSAVKEAKATTKKGK